MRPRLAKMPCRTCNRWSPGLPSNVSTGGHVIWPSPFADGNGVAYGVRDNRAKRATRGVRWQETT